MAENVEEPWTQARGMFASLLAGPVLFLFAFLYLIVGAGWGH